MFKNIASQKAIFYAFDSTTNLPKTGDAANITAYVSKDYGAVTVLGDTSATELDATNAKGYYIFDLTQAESNADTDMFSAKSSTANIVVLAMPAVVFTRPPNFSKAVIDAAGLIDATAVKVGPTGAGTAQTAGDVGIKTGFRLSSTGVADLWNEATSGHTTAGTYGDKFGAHLPAVLKGLTTAGSTTTTIVMNATTGLDGGVPSAVNDFYNGAVLIFTSGALAGQRTSVTAYVGATQTLTVVAVTGSAASGVTFVLV